MVKKGKWTVPGWCLIHVSFQMFSDYIFFLRLQGEVWRSQCHVIYPRPIEIQRVHAQILTIFCEIPFGHEILLAYMVLWLGIVRCLYRLEGSL
jgi:hypothetical protein